MRVGYEALAWGRHTFDHRDAWSLIRDVDLMRKTAGDWQGSTMGDALPFTQKLGGANRRPS